MKYLSAYLILTFITVACGNRPEATLNEPLRPECIKDRAACPKVSVGRSGDTLSDEDALALDLTINRKSEGENVNNTISLGSLNAQSKTSRTFSLKRLDKGRLSLIRADVSASCATGTLPKLKFFLYEEGSLVVETGSLIKDSAIRAHKKYLLKVDVASSVVCTSAQLNLVAGYETDGVEVPFEGNSKVPIKDRNRKTSQKVEVESLLCKVATSSARLNRISKVELDLKSTPIVTLIDGTTKLPFVSRNVLCGAAVDMNDPQVTCTNTKTNTSRQLKSIRACQKEVVKNGSRQVEWSREIQIIVSGDQSATIECMGASDVDAMSFNLESCQRL